MDRVAYPYIRRYPTLRPLKEFSAIPDLLRVPLGHKYLCWATSLPDVDDDILRAFKIGRSGNGNRRTSQCDVVETSLQVTSVSRLLRTEKHQAFQIQAIINSHVK
jgi:hypothetical protein